MQEDTCINPVNSSNYSNYNTMKTKCIYKLHGLKAELPN